MVATGTAGLICSGQFATVINCNISLTSQSQFFSFSCSLSISSTLMDMESTVSSGRSTPAMMNGQGSAAQCHSTTKGQAVGYTCCWDQCGLCFTCSPDLAEHIRGVHVDGQRGGVGRTRVIQAVL